MKNVCTRGVPFLVLLAVVYALPATAQTNPKAVLSLPVTGSFHGGGDFTGTISINRFEVRDAHVMAIGFVSGVLTRGNRTLGTAVTGEVAWPVAVKTGGIDLAQGRELTRPPATLIAFMRPSSPRLMLAQSTPPCPVLDVALGAINVNLLGAQVALPPISLSLSGQTGPLGDLICSASDLLGNVAGVVNLLNSILGLVTGLLGGLTGGLGGVVP
jgi:hypothetical protein